MHGSRAARYRVDSPHLSAWVEESAGAAIVLVVAPAGYGKSTLLHAFRERMQEARLATAWIALAAEDDDLVRFAARILDALGVADAGIEPASLLDSSLAGAQAAQRALDALARPRQALALFIDDFDHLQSPPLLQLVQRMLETMSPQLRVFIAARAQPPLKLVRWKVQGRLLQIGTRELAFDDELADEFLNRRHQLGLAPPQVARLRRAAEGWPSGLQLAALALDASPDRAAFIERFCAADADIAEYLLQEVYGALPQDLREFLLATSVLDALTAPLANATVGIADSAARLRELERRNLFVQRDALQPDALRCHPLFRDFLRERLREESPVRAAQLHRRAAAWHEAQGDFAAAIDHALAGGDTDSAVGWLAPRVWPAMLAGRLALVSRWLSALPRAATPATLRAALGWAQVLQHRYAEAEALVAELRSDPATRDEPELRVLEPMTLGLVERLDDAERALASTPQDAFDASYSGCTLLNVRAFVSLAAQRWDAALADAHAARAGFAALGGHYGQAFAIGFEAHALLARGERAASFALLEAALDDLLRHGDAGAAGSAHVGVYLAESCYERGDFERAAKLLAPRVDAVRSSGIVDTVIVCHRLLSRLACRAGDYPEATQATQAAAELGQRLGLARVVAAMRLEALYQVVHQFDHGRLDRLPAWPGDDPVWTQWQGRLAPANDVEQPLAARLRLLLRSAGAQAACEAIDAALPLALQHGRERLAWRLRLLRAQAQAALGRHDEALRALGELLDAHAEAIGVAALQDEGPPLLALCARLLASRRWAPGSPARGVLERALEGAAAKASPPAASWPAAPPPATAPLEPLSERELEVLRCIVEGLPNKRIAARLHISEPTVKFHLRNINAKLGARNRTHAVFIARQAGMVA
ncbi:MAG: LuxR C-terminal-related transcriptional regulator [Rubrivivax sp.]